MNASDAMNARQVLGGFAWLNLASGTVACGLMLHLGSPAGASDWPQFLGPTRDAVYAGPPLSEDWPREGPKIVWQVEVGQGYSSPVVGEGHLIICHRPANDLVVDCLDPKTGQRIWQFTHAMKFTDGAFFDSGPRPTPTIKDGRVFVFNTDGYFVCLDLKAGEKLWSRHVKSEFKSSATWHGCVASPLVTDKAVILTVGGTNSAGVVALACDSGKTLWQAFDEKASAASPVPALLHGKARVLAVTRSALHCCDPDTGAEAWSLPTRRQNSGNVFAASPIVVGDHVWLSGWYKLGAQWLRAKPDGVENVWQRDDAISTHYAIVIIREGYAYGFHGHAAERGGPNLRCVELATGKVRWEQPQVGSGTIIRAGDNLLILSERGQLQLAKASPTEFKIKCRAQVVTPTTRSYPALADGYAFVKGPRKLVCVDLRAQSGSGKP